MKAKYYIGTEEVSKKVYDTVQMYKQNNEHLQLTIEDLKRERENTVVLLDLSYLTHCRRECFVVFDSGWKKPEIIEGELTIINLKEKTVVIRANDELQKEYAKGGYYHELTYTCLFKDYGTTWSFHKRNLLKTYKEKKGK